MVRKLGETIRAVKAHGFSLYALQGACYTAIAWRAEPI